MSSTNRGYSRHKSDYYITPVNHIMRFLKTFNEKVSKFDGIILDPSAGGDSQHEMSYPMALMLHGVNGKFLHTMDIRDDSKAEIKCNYLETTLDYEPKFIFTNPPFVDAIEFIEKALNDIQNDGYVIMLLRLNFFGSKGRKEFFERCMPKYCFVDHIRMSFTNDGKTDSIEYAHFVWQKGYDKDYCKTYVY